MVTIKWKYRVLVRQDGPTQRGESLRRDTPYYTPAAQTTYIEVRRSNCDEEGRGNCILALRLSVTVYSCSVCHSIVSVCRWSAPSCS